MRAAVIGVAVIAIAIAALISNRRTAPPQPGRAIESIAVMPFKHQGADQTMAYLADGLTDSVTSNLSQLNELRVMSRTTIDRFKDQDALKAGRDLGVQAVLVGSVEPRTDAVTINLELINVEDGRQLWGKQFPRPLNDLVRLQSDISAAVAENLQPTLTGKEQARLKQVPTENAAAYQLYLRGRFYARQVTEDSLRTAVDFYSQAIQLDPKFTLAHIALADAYIMQGIDSVAAKEAMPKASEQALLALQLEPDNPEAHAALGIVRLAYDWDWKGAAQELESAHAQESSTIETFSCALHYADPLGRNQDAIAALQSAVVSEPQSLPKNLELGCASYYGRQYAQAIRQFRGTLAIYPNHPLAIFSLGRSLTQSGKADQAVSELRKAIQAIGPWPPLVSELGYALARAGKPDEARATLKTLADESHSRYVDPYLVASVQIGLGDKNAAFRELSRAVDERSASLPWLKVEPKWDPLHGDPRFNALLKRVGLPVSS
jgi:serine/threonine-protein kinase